MKYLMCAIGVLTLASCSDSTGPACEFGDKERVRAVIEMMCPPDFYRGTPTEWEIRGVDGCVVSGYEENYTRGDYTATAWLDLPVNETYHVRIWTRGSHVLRHEATFMIGANDTTFCIAY